MDAMNYLSPVSSIDSIKSENFIRLFEDSLGSSDLTKCLDANDLRELRQYFYLDGNDNFKTPFHSQEFYYEGRSLTKEDFADAILQIFGKEHLKSSALKFFEDLQKRNIINDTISWRHILDTIIEQSKTQKSDVSSIESCPVLEFKYKCSASHSKDTIIDIVAIETTNSFSYIVASICGKIGLYDEHMYLRGAYELPSPNFRRKNKWVTCVSYTSSGCSFFLSMFDRTLYVYNTTRLEHRLKFIISELPNIIKCMRFGHNEKNRKLLMLLGDDLGNIYFLIFHQHLKSFFEEQPNTETGRYFWSEIKNQTKWVTVHCLNRVHKEFVMNVEYLPKKNLMISCSKYSISSLFISLLGEKKNSKTCKLRKGLVCMAYDGKFGYLATSSSDKFITLWNSHNQIQPITDLHGHETNVIDICFMANTKSLLSISKDGVLKLWNTETYRCLQSVELEFISPSKCYLGSKIIFKRMTSEPENTSGSSDFVRSKVSEVLISSENTITIFSVKGCEVLQKKPLPLKNLEPKLPSPEMIFKHYNRENPLSFGELKKIELKEQTPIEDKREDVQQFIKQGAVYLGLKLVTVTDNTSIYGSHF